MFRKSNDKVLAILLAVLLAGVIFTEVMDFRKSGRTFQKDLVEVDAGVVTSLEVYPRMTGGKQIRLAKENEVWQVEYEGNKFPADATLPGMLIGELNRLKPERVAASGKDRWERYQVNDSLATRVKLFKDADLLADLFIGKFSYSPEGRMTSFVRPAGESRVYGVEGMPGITFNRDIHYFRNKQVIRSSPSDWTRLVFTYPADSSFTLEKIGERWVSGGTTADSARVAAYFSTLSNLTESTFSPVVPLEAPTHRLRIEGNNQMVPVEISGHFSDEYGYIIESSQNRGNHFNSGELANKIFVSKQSFL